MMESRPETQEHWAGREGRPGHHSHVKGWARRVGWRSWGCPSASSLGDRPSLTL